MEDNEILVDLNDDSNDIEIEGSETVQISQDNYEELYNKPQINNVELIGNKTSTQLGLASEANAGATLELSINTLTYVMTLQLKNINGTVLSTGTVDLPIESMIINASYDSTTKSLILTLQSGQTITVGISDLISGLVSTNELNVILSNYYTKVQINSQIGAPAYDSTATYEVGEIVLHDNNLYSCNTTITVPEQWNSSHWTQTNVLSSAGGNEVVIGTSEDITSKTKIFIDESEGTDAYSEVVNSLSGNEIAKAPSVRAVNEALLDVYSTEEVRIGTWIDGKPLYRKTFTGTTGSVDYVDLPTSNIDKLIRENGHIDYSSTMQFPIPSTFGTTGANDIRVIKLNDNYFRIQVGSSLLNKSYEVSVEYTKTSD